MHNPATQIPPVLSATALHSTGASIGAGSSALALPDGLFQILRSSQKLEWKGMTAVQSVSEIGEYAVTAEDALWLSIPLDKVKAVTEVEGKTFQVATDSGGVFIQPPKQKFLIDNLVPTRALHLFVDGPVLKSVADQIYDRPLENMDILNAFDSADAGLGHLINAVHHYLDEPQTAAWRADYMAHAIAAHVLSKHVQYRHLALTRDSQAPISENQLRQLREFFEANLDGNIDFAEMAASIGVGRTLFFERFKRTTGRTPNQFLQALRVKRAQQLLAKSNLAAAEVAIAAGFADQAHMTHIFKRIAGTTPARFRSDLRRPELA